MQQQARALPRTLSGKGWHQHPLEMPLAPQADMDKAAAEVEGVRDAIAKTRATLERRRKQTAVLHCNVEDLKARIGSCSAA